MSKQLIEIIGAHEDLVSTIKVEGKQVCSAPISPKPLALMLEIIFDKLVIENVEIQVK